MEQNLERFTEIVGDFIALKSTSHTDAIQANLQLAQAEQLQGIRKALEGILREMKMQKPDTKEDNRPMADLSKTPTA